MDLLRMSFVIEIVPTHELPASPEDEDQVWFKESSASLLEKVDYITGNCRIRELHAGEKEQVNNLKKVNSYYLKVIYKNGKTQIQSWINTVSLSCAVMDTMFSFVAQNDLNNVKSVDLMEVKDKSFTIESARVSNCEKLESLGLRGRCDGRVWIELL